MASQKHANEINIEPSNPTRPAWTITAIAAGVYAFVYISGLRQGYEPMQPWLHAMLIGFVLLGLFLVFYAKVVSASYLKINEERLSLVNEFHTSGGGGKLVNLAINDISTVHIGTLSYFEKELSKSTESDNSPIESWLERLLGYATLGLLSGGVAGGIFAKQHAIPWIIISTIDGFIYGYNLSTYSKEDIKKTVDTLKSRSIPVKVQESIFGQKLLD